MKKNILIIFIFLIFLLFYKINNIEKFSKIIITKDIWNKQLGYYNSFIKNISDNINSISMDSIYFDLSTKEMDGVDEIITNDLSIDDSKSFDYSVR